jgi:hypothetical protein
MLVVSQLASSFQQKSEGTSRVRLLITSIQWLQQWVQDLSGILFPSFLLCKERE